jgi:hypothetical protein
MLGRAAPCGSERSFPEVGPPSRSAGYDPPHVPRQPPISAARWCRPAGPTMLWTYIRRHSNDEPRCGETSPLSFVPGRSKCPSDEEVKLITRPALCNGPPMLFPSSPGEVSVSAKVPVKIVVPADRRPHGPRSEEAREERETVVHAIHELRALDVTAHAWALLCLDHSSLHGAP